MGYHSDTRKMKVIKTIIVDADTKALLRQKFRLADTMQKRISGLFLGI